MSSTLSTNDCCTGFYKQLSKTFENEREAEIAKSVAEDELLDKLISGTISKKEYRDLVLEAEIREADRKRTDVNNVLEQLQRECKIPKHLHVGTLRMEIEDGLNTFTGSTTNENKDENDLVDVDLEETSQGENASKDFTLSSTIEGEDASTKTRCMGQTRLCLKIEDWFEERAEKIFSRGLYLPNGRRVITPEEVKEHDREMAAVQLLYDRNNGIITTDEYEQRRERAEDEEYFLKSGTIQAFHDILKRSTDNLYNYLVIALTDDVAEMLYKSLHPTIKIIDDLKRELNPDDGDMEARAEPLIRLLQLKANE